MKNVGKLAVLVAVLAASATSAFATILTGGLTVVGNDVTDDTFTTTSITFPGVNPNALITGATGNLGVAGLNVGGATGVMSGFTSSSTNLNILAVNDSPTNLIFKLTSVLTWTDIYTPGIGTALTVQGFGEFLDSVGGDTPAFGAFILTSNAVGCASTTCSTGDIGFSFTPSASNVTPEPSSLMLLGTGLLSAAGLMFRRRRQTV